jgi:intron-binding protein aquarius
MTGVEHLGQYVFEMTKAKVQQIKEGDGKLPPPDAAVEGVRDASDEDEEMGAAVEEEDGGEHDDYEEEEEGKGKEAAV